MAAPSATLLSLLPPMFFWHFIGWVRPLLCDILLWFLLVRALRPSRTWRILLAVLLALDAAQAPILSYLGDSYLMPDLPGPLYAALKLLRGFALLFFLEAILLWPILALARRLRRPPAPSPRPARRLALALLLANAALLATAFANAVVPPRTAVRELPVVGLPPDLDGYRILHLSDLHADPIAGAWRTRAIVRRANETAPDLVCITGDFADGSCARFAPALAPLADLRAPDGLYACTGNHEYYPPSVHSGWPAFFADLGIRFPVDAPAIVPRGAAHVAVASLPDNAPPGAALPPLPGDFNLYLKHRPVDLAPLAAAGTDLILSGHTHGGQFPPLTRLVAAANEGHLSGLYPITPRTRLHVSPGTGQWNGVPYRFPRPSELTLLVLRPAAP